MKFTPNLFYICLFSLSIGLASCGSGGGNKQATNNATSSPSSGSVTSSVAAASGDIKLNQLGYTPFAEKIALIPSLSGSHFTIVQTGTNTLAYSGDLTAAAIWEPAGESVKIANFSGLTIAGDYEIRVDDLAKAASFSISAQAYDALSASALKAFYFNRASTALLETHAGVYQRNAGQPDDKVYIHASAASPSRPEGTLISATKGWYDAGDFNKYIVNSGISTYTLMAAYESFPLYFKNQTLNIPESGDAVPDVLNEIMWNLEWMLAMQDPHDGGVYHKLTSKTFSGLGMPETDFSTRYVIQKTTAAALDFAAVMATASRVYAPYEANYPGLPAKMLAAAKSAWAWAKANPSVYYKQPSDITTGTYDDNDTRDEFSWAAAELYVTTKENTYYTEMNPSTMIADVPAWVNVKSLAWVSLANNINNLTSLADKTLIKNRIDSLAASLSAKKASSAYAVSLDNNDFVWGSNAVALNQAMMLLIAYQLDNTKKTYLNSAQALFDYTLGRNATDYSFVTGFGKRSPLNIHHRTSIADTIANPIPGFLVGGPNPGQQDKKDCSNAYTSGLPAKSYLDDICSYASNEVAINWNAPLVYVATALQVLTP